MSLNWKINKIVNKEKVCWVGDAEPNYMNPVTESLIWRTMSLDLGEITKKNIPEWMFRTRYYSRVFGKPLRRVVQRCNGCRNEIKDGEQCCSAELPGVADHIEDFDYSEEDLRAHIGLSTNVRSTTRANFLRKMTTALACDVERVLSQERQRKTEAA
jgi:hypothetical protein